MKTTAAIACTLLCTALFAQQKGTFTDARDGKIYKTTKIGEQVWMAENLNYEASGSKCYDNKPAYCDKYGRLYYWNTAMALPNSCKSKECVSQIDTKHKGICPTGWHLPSEAEWKVLTKTVGNWRTAGKYLKATSGWNENGNGEDRFGFSALPGGFGLGSYIERLKVSPLFSDGYSYLDNYIDRLKETLSILSFFDDFIRVGDSGEWWCASEIDDSFACTRWMDYDSEYIYTFGTYKNTLKSIRCVQDPTTKEPPAQQKGTFTDTRDGKTYKTVKIGEQTWMAENLNYEAKGSRCYGEGGLVYDGIDLTKLSPAEIQANCNKYGKLYDLETAMKACPSGWHLPDSLEWGVLTKTVGGEKTAGKYLKATSGWKNNRGRRGNSDNGEDKFGFSALPGGYGYSGGNFYSVGDRGNWWSSSEYLSNNTYWWYMGHDFEYVFSSSGKKDVLLSVRCIQNTPAPPKGTAK